MAGMTETDLKQNLKNLREAVLDSDFNAAKEAVKKISSDLFSGSPTDNKRRFQLVNEEIAHIGHTIYAHDADEDREEDEKKEAQMRAFEMALDELLHAIQEMEDIREQQIFFTIQLEKLKIEHADIVKNIENATFNLKTVNERLQTLEEKDRQNIVDLKELEQKTVNTYGAIGDILKGHNEDLVKEFYRNVFAVDYEYVTMAHDMGSGMRSHIVWQDEDGTYYLKNPDTGERVDIDQNNPNLLGALRAETGKESKTKQKLASDSNPEDHDASERFNNTYKKYMKEVNCHPELREAHEELVGIMADREKLFGLQVEFERKIEELRDRKEQLEQEIEKLKEQKLANEEKTTEIQKKLEKLECDEEALLEKMEENELAVMGFTVDSSVRLKEIVVALERADFERDNMALKDHFHKTGANGINNPETEKPTQHAAARHPNHGQTSKEFQLAAAGKALETGALTAETKPTNTTLIVTTGANT